PASGTVEPTAVQTGSVNESTEGVLVQLDNVWVASINTDTSFVVTDGSGNVTIGRGWRTTYVPQVNDTIRYVRGLVAYSSNRFSVNPRTDLDLGFFGNRPPIISQVTNRPETPTTLESDTVVAVVSDDESVAGAEIFYRFHAADNFSTAPMYDDG